MGATPATLGDKRQACGPRQGPPPSGDEAPQTRWQHLATKVAPARRRFPRDTEGAGFLSNRQTRPMFAVHGQQSLLLSA